MKTEDKVANAIKWIDGLLVTTVKQGDGQLGNSEIGFCCLGYGCHVLDIVCRPTMGFSSTFAVNVGLRHEEGFFSPPMFLDVGSRCNSLSQLNDRGGWSFSQIAKFMIDRDFSMFEDDVAAQLVGHYNNVA